MFEFESLQRALGELSQEVTTVKVLAALLVLACLTFHDRMVAYHCMIPPPHLSLLFVLF